MVTKISSGFLHSLTVSCSFITFINNSKLTAPDVFWKSSELYKVEISYQSSFKSKIGYSFVTKILNIFLENFELKEQILSHINKEAAMRWPVS